MWVPLLLGCSGVGLTTTGDTGTPPTTPAISSVPSPTTVPTLPTSTSTTTAAWPDLETSCAATWPPATCLGGCPDRENALWAEGYLDYVAGAWGLPRSTVDQHLRVRHVESSGFPSRSVELTAQLEADWVVSVFDVRASLPGPPTSVAEAAGAYGEFGSEAPQVDVTAPPRPWSEVETLIADCELELGVTFPDKGCDSYVTFDPDDDDQAGVRFDLEAPLTVRQFAYATVYAWRSEPDQCGTTTTTSSSLR